jgi:catecholate siderophore receptor
MNYGMPWIRPTPTSPVSETTLLPLDPKAYYGLASDRNAGSATTYGLQHTHRFSPKVELVTKLRRGEYTATSAPAPSASPPPRSSPAARP